MEIKKEKPSVRGYGKFISYHFLDDPNVFAMPYGPQKEKRMPSYFEVFLCPDDWWKSQIGQDLPVWVLQTFFFLIIYKFLHSERNKSSIGGQDLCYKTNI